MGLDSLGSGDPADKNLSADRLIQNLMKTTAVARNEKSEGGGKGERKQEKANQTVRKKLLYLKADQQAAGLENTEAFDVRCAQPAGKKQRTGVHM